MRYQVKQKIFSLTDKFFVKNENGDDIYSIKGEFFSIGAKFRIMDMAENELVYIEQKLFRFLPEFTIYLNGSPSATVKKEFTLFTPSFNIQSNMGRYQMTGDFFDHEFEIQKDGEAVCQVSKQWFAFSDTYGVNVVDSENQAFMLALVIVIDKVLHDDKNNR